MLQQVILHIGLHKTGTTAIQGAMRAYDDGETAYARLSHDNHSFPVYTAFDARYQTYHPWQKLGYGPEKIAALRRQYRDDITRELQRQDRHRLIFSGEDICILEDTGLRDFLDLIQAHCAKITVIVYVRDPLSFAASSFQQQVRGGARNLPKRFDPFYKHRIEKFRNLVGQDNIILRAYAPETFPNRSIVADFCTVLGLDTGHVKNVFSNESLGAQGTRLLFAFNRENPCFAGDPVLHRARERLIDLLATSYGQGPTLEARCFAARTNLQAADYLQETFGFSFPDPPYSVISAEDGLIAWVNDRGDIDPAPLVEKLREFGIAFGGQDPVQALHRLYAQYVHLESLKPDGVGDTSSTWRSRRLHHIARKTEDGKKLSLGEALFLMALAIEQGLLSRWFKPKP